MTLRLVALMSVVLLLSLAAFGLLMAHHQDQVMQEVARTASAVGKAALRTLEVREFPGGVEADWAQAEDVFHWQAAPGEATEGEPGRPLRRTSSRRS